MVWIFRTFKYETAEIREETHETEKKAFSIEFVWQGPSRAKLL